MSTKLYHYGVVKYDVYDGDTVKLILDLGFNLPYGHESKRTSKWPAVRITGIDTPELRKRRQKEAGYAVKKVVQRVLAQHDRLIVQSISLDKYAGRFIGDILMGAEEISLSEWLIEKGVARRYDGGTKRPWSDIFLKTVYNRCMRILESDEMKFISQQEFEEAVANAA
jgi:endonuclease YncB( thermonuclease family)